MILYFHGFGSHGNSWKPNLLKKRLADEPILAETLPANPAEIEIYGDQIIDKNRPALLIGSSLGGFYACYFAKKHSIPAVIINPALEPWITLRQYIGWNNRSDGAGSFEWKAEYLDMLSVMGDRVLDGKIRSDHIFFYLATDDELLDHTAVGQRFPDAGVIRYFDHCRHTFLCFDRIIPDIKRMLDSLKKP